MLTVRFAVIASVAALHACRAGRRLLVDARARLVSFRRSGSSAGRLRPALVHRHFSHWRLPRLGGYVADGDGPKHHPMNCEEPPAICYSPRCIRNVAN